MMMEVAQYFNKFYNLILKEHISDTLIHSEWIYFLSMFKNNPLEKDRLEMYLGILTNEKKKKSGISLPQIIHTDLSENGHKLNPDMLSHTLPIKYTDTQYLNHLKDKYSKDHISKAFDQTETKIKSKFPNQDFTFENLDFTTIKLEKRYSENAKPLPSDHKNKTFAENNQNIISLNRRLSSILPDESSINTAESKTSGTTLTFLDEVWRGSGSKGRNDENCYATSTNSKSNSNANMVINNMFSNQRKEEKYKKMVDASSKLVRLFESNSAKYRA